MLLSVLVCPKGLHTEAPALTFPSVLASCYVNDCMALPSFYFAHYIIINHLW